MVKLSDVLGLVKLRNLIRIRGLKIDIETQNNKDFFKGAKQEIEELNRHLDSINWIIADIECGKSKYLSIPEVREFEKIKALASQSQNTALSGNAFENKTPTDESSDTLKQGSTLITNSKKNSVVSSRGNPVLCKDWIEISESDWKETDGRTLQIREDVSHDKIIDEGYPIIKYYKFEPQSQEKGGQHG